MPSFTFLCPIRWSDIDSYGHVNNVQYFRLLEEARVALFFEQARKDGLTTLDGALVVVRHEIDYRRSMRYRPEPVTIELWAEEIRVSSCTIGYEVRDDARTYAEARSVLAAYDAEEERARRLSERERAWLERYHRPGGS